MAEEPHNSRGRLRFRRLLCCFHSCDTSPAYPSSHTRSASEPPTPTRPHLPDISSSMDQSPRGEPTPESRTSLAMEERTQQRTSPATQQHASPINATWTVFKEVLKATERASDAFPPLKSAVAGLNHVLDRVKMVSDTQTDLTYARDRIMRFMAILHEYQDSTVAIPRAVRDCMDGFARVIDAQRFSIEDKLERGIIKRIIEVSDDQAEIVGFARTIGYLVDQLVVAASLNTERNVRELLKDAKFNKLSHVAQAAFNGPHSHGKGCMSGTRVSVLARLLSWAIDPNAHNLYWLTGLAGTGKSAIAYSFCRLLNDINILGGSFFCSRQATLGQRNVHSVVPTLAHFMAQMFPQYAEALLQSLDKVPDAANLSVDEQFRNLMLEPCVSISRADSKIHVLVIDALDECEDSEITATLVELFIRHASALKVKIFITSRPEKDLRVKFHQLDCEHIFYLHHIEDSFIKSDIRMYLQKQLTDIFKNHYDSEEPKPSLTQIEKLCTQADKLFIYAFTSLQYIKAKNADPEKRLHILTDVNSVGLHSIEDQFGGLYQFILSAAFQGLNEHEISDCQHFLMCVLLQLEPMSVELISKFLDVKIHYMQAMMNGFQSVFDIPSNIHDGCITAFHASFRDYITNKDTNNNFVWNLNIATGHDYMTHRCFEIMSKHLCFNIYQHKTSYLANDKKHLTKIPKEVVYACWYWPYHFLKSSYKETLLNQFTNWMHNQFFYWLEVISVTDMHMNSIIILRQVYQFCNENHAISLAESTLLNDILHFMKDYNEPICKSIAHIYISALAFGVTEFDSFKIYKKLFPRLLSVYSNFQSDSYVNVLTLAEFYDIVDSVVFSSDGKHILYGSYNNTIRIWSPDTGEALETPLEGHVSDVNSVTLSPDGKYIVSSSNDCIIRKWSLETGKIAGSPMKGHTGPVFSVAFSPDGKYIVSVSDDNTVRIWSLETSKPVENPIEKNTSNVASVAISSDKNFIAFGCTDCTIRMWNVKIGQTVGSPIKGHLGCVLSVAFSSDRKYIVSGSVDKTIRIWRADTGEAIGYPLIGHTSGIYSVAFSPDGRYIVSIAGDNTIRRWSMETGEAIGITIRMHTSSIMSVTFSLDGKYIVSGSLDHIIRISWGLGTNILVEHPIDRQVPGMIMLTISSDKNYIVSNLANHTIRVWSSETSEAGPIEGHTSCVYSIVFPLDKQYTIYGSDDHTIRRWSSETDGALGIPIEECTYKINAVAISPDKIHVVFGSSDGTIKIWNSKTGKASRSPIERHSGPILLVKFSPDGKYVASTSVDNTIRIWRSDTGEAIGNPIQVHTLSVKSIAFSPNGRYIAFGYDNGTIRMWSTDNGEAIGSPMEGHTKSVLSVAFSPDGRYIVSGSYDHTIRIWSTETGVPIKRLKEKIMPYIASNTSDVYRNSTHNNPAPNTSDIVDIEAAVKTAAKDKKEPWVLGPNKELLLWIPHRYLHNLCWPHNAFIIAKNICTLDLSKFEHGKTWTHCIRPLPGLD